MFDWKDVLYDLKNTIVVFLDFQRALETIKPKLSKCYKIGIFINKLKFCQDLCNKPQTSSKTRRY